MLVFSFLTGHARIRFRPRNGYFLHRVVESLPTAGQQAGQGRGDKRAQQAGRGEGSGRRFGRRFGRRKLGREVWAGVRAEGFGRSSRRLSGATWASKGRGYRGDAAGKEGQQDAAPGAAGRVWAGGTSVGGRGEYGRAGSEAFRTPPRRISVLRASCGRRPPRQSGAP